MTEQSISPEAIAELRERLRGAREAQTPRQTLIASLVAITNLLEGMPGFEIEGLHSPFWSLALALADLDSGIVAKVLRPTEGFNNKHPDSTARKMMKAYSAICVDALVRRYGLDLEIACRAVAEGLQESGYFKSNATERWKTVRTWRYEASKLSEKDPQRLILDGLRKELFTMDLPDEASARAHIVKLINRMFLLVGRFD